jgi:superfamily II DNA helicase RecQ
MAKETVKKTEEKIEESKAVATLEPVDPSGRFGKNVKLVPFSTTAVADFGKSFAISLVAAATLEADAQAALAQAGEAKQYLGFEMTRAIFALASEHKEGKDAIDVYSVFGDAKDVERLNNRVLIHLGILRKEIDENDDVKYIWTDKTVEKLYAYTKDLKEKDAEEYEKRFNNRKRLNMRLSEAYKAAAALFDAKLTPDDLYYSEDPETKALVPTIRNAPKAIGGDAKTVQLGGRKPVKGADLSPTMSSLVQLAAKKHKAPKADRNDKGENREGEAKLGMTDEAFGQICNNFKRAVTAQEGQFTEEMRKQILSLVDFITPIVKEFASKKKEAA